MNSADKTAIVCVMAALYSAGVPLKDASEEAIRVVRIYKDLHAPDDLAQAERMVQSKPRRAGGLVSCASCGGRTSASRKTCKHCGEPVG